MDKVQAEAASGRRRARVLYLMSKFVLGASAVWMVVGPSEARRFVALFFFGAAFLASEWMVWFDPDRVASVLNLRIGSSRTPISVFKAPGEPYIMTFDVDSEMLDVPCVLVHRYAELPHLAYVTQITDSNACCLGTREHALVKTGCEWKDRLSALGLQCFRLEEHHPQRARGSTVVSDDGYGTQRA